jgi:hypothetical protein
MPQEGKEFDAPFSLCSWRLFLCVLAFATPSRAEPQSHSAVEQGCYAMTPAEGGFLRLDTQTGSVSFCSTKDGQSVCRAGADEIAALEAADPTTLLVGFRGRSRHPRVLVTEIDALMNKIADRLDARPTRRCIFEQSPNQIQHPIAVAL